MKPESETTDDEEICWRRFGPKHEKPCNDPTIETCAMSECQETNECQKKQ